MSKTELLMAKVPTKQNMRMAGMSTSRGTRKICLTTLMHNRPNGIKMRLAKMNSKNTA